MARVLLFCLISLCTLAQATEQKMIFDAYASELPKDTSWKEAYLYYDAKKTLKDPSSSILGSLGVRYTELNIDHHRNRPTQFPALLATVGSEKQFDAWNWKATFEGAFQAPSFDPLRSTRYTAEGIGTYTWSDRMTTKIGAGIQFGIRSTNAYPIIGIFYKTLCWNFDLYYPYIMSATYQLTEKDSIGPYIANTLTRTYRTKEVYGREKGIINMKAQFAGLLWKHRFSEKTALVASTAWNIHTRASAGDRLNNHLKTITNSSGGLLLYLSIKHDL